MMWKAAASSVLCVTKAPMLATAKETMNVIKSGHRVWVQGMAMTPTLLTSAMTDHAVENKLRDIHVYHLHTEGPCPYVSPEASKIFKTKSCFMGSNVRQAVSDGRADYVPCLLSDLPRMIRQDIIPIDVALVQASPPDQDGYCSLGTSVESTLAAIEKANTVICQINDNVPRLGGDARLHFSTFDYLVENHNPLYTVNAKPITDDEAKIGELIANNLIPDGATLQMGIGSIPDAVLSLLGNHRDLGVHTEMFSDGVVPLVQSGVINNRLKTLDRGKMVASFIVGSQNLFNFIDNNPVVEMRDVAYTNDPNTISQQNKMISINSCIQIDITGQVCADSIGTRMYSGTGGQVDFVYGSSIAPGGKSIIAITARSKKGQPRIVPLLTEGSGVVTTRSHVQYVVTEYGIASLRGKSLRERCQELIKIAHPDDQDALKNAAKQRGLL